jgi:hypothetical protein
MVKEQTIHIGPLICEWPRYPETIDLEGTSDLRYAWLYLIFITLSSLDLIFTSTILLMGGEELNWIANQVIASGGLTGIVAFKYALVVLVIIMIENIGRIRHEVGERIAMLAIAITTIPVIVGLTQLLVELTVGFSNL